MKSKPILFGGAMLIWMVAFGFQLCGFGGAAIGALTIGLVPLALIALDIARTVKK